MKNRPKADFICASGWNYHELLNTMIRVVHILLSTLDPSSQTSTPFSRLVYLLRFSNPGFDITFLVHYIHKNVSARLACFCIRHSKNIAPPVKSNRTQNCLRAPDAQMKNRPKADFICASGWI